MDNYLVSARKYRPDTFESVVGQSALTTTLKNAVKNNQLAHAYLFCGPRGVGKTTCARIFAKTINCMNPGPNGEACNACESCKSFIEQRSFNIFELDAASNNSVEGIRTLVDQVRIPPQLGKYKVYIIDEVHMLSSNAFNAFLKTLEEPPHHAIFILATTEKHKIIPTILSRCQIYDFNRISVADIVAQLRFVAASEHKEAEEEALNVIAVKADGGMRDALSIFDQVASYGNGKITYQHTIENLNVLDYDYYFKLTSFLLAGDVPGALLIFNDILNHGFDGQQFITGLSAHFRDLLVCKDPATLILLEVGANIRNKYQKQAAECPVDFLYVAIKYGNECDLSYRESKNKRLLVELTLIRIAQLTDSKKKIRELLEGESNSPILPLSTKSEKPAVQVKVQPPSSAEHTVPPIKTDVPAEKSVKKPTNGGELSGYRSVRSIRLDSEQKVSEKKEDRSLNEPVSQTLNKRFSPEELAKAWIDFTTTISGDIHLVNGMKACLPDQLDDTHVEVVVSNQVLQKKIEKLHSKIETYLRKTLQNDFIDIQLRIDETGVNSRPFTARERLNSMVKKNPNLLDLYRMFGLEID
jgi:DNA polymerase-3 subunit gamma/tau